MRLPEALALGALQGPAELLPVSSSAHVELVPWLAGWEHRSLDPELRKAFGVALHAGTAAALLLARRDEAADALGRRGTAVLMAGSFAVPAAVGLALERPIERRLGGPRATVAGLLAGSAAMLLADRAAGRRGAGEATLTDALALGVAQACALVPGVSRNGATLVAARLRGFARRDASVLSRHIALPVIAGASAVKGARLARRGLPPAERAAFAAGTAAAFTSTLLCARLIDDRRRLWPFAVYRVGLAALVLWQHGRR